MGCILSKHMGTMLCRILTQSSVCKKEACHLNRNSADSLSTRCLKASVETPAQLFTFMPSVLCKLVQEYPELFACNSRGNIAALKEDWQDLRDPALQFPRRRRNAGFPLSHPAALLGVVLLSPSSADEVEGSQDSARALNPKASLLLGRLRIFSCS